MSTNYDDFITTGPAAHTLAAQDKFADLQQASTDKIAELEQRRLFQQARDKAVAESIVGRIGLNPNDTGGAIINRGVATVNDLTDGIGAVGSGVTEQYAKFLKNNISLEARNAHQRVIAGRANEEDTALLNQVAPGMLGIQNKTNASYLNEADRASAFSQTIEQRREKLAKTVAPDENGIKPTGLAQMGVDAGLSLVNSAIAVPEAVVGIASLVSGGAAGKYLADAGFKPAEAKEFINSLKSAEMQAASQSVNGAEGFWNTLSEIANNPSTVPHMLLESLFPMLAGGVAARGIVALGAGVRMATAAGEGLVMAGSGAENIRNQTADNRLTLKQSLLAASTGVMGAGVARLSGGAAARLGLGDIDEAITKGTLGISNRGVITRTGGSAVFEGGEEALQSTGETIASNVALDQQWDKGVGNAAAIGAVTGAAMGAPMGLAQGVKQKAQIYQDANKIKADAIASGDVSKLSDPTSPSYNPTEAIAALAGNAKIDTATPESKQANIAKADEIVAVLETKREALMADFAADTAKGVKETIAKTQADLDKIDPANTSRIEKTKSYLSNLKTQLVELKQNTQDAKQTRKIEKELADLSAQIDQANVAKSQLSAAVSSSSDIAEKLATANQTVDAADSVAVTASKDAANQIFNLAMASPELLDQAKIRELVANKSNGLSESQRDYLRKFSEARVAQNLLLDAGEVSRQIYLGSEGSVGIKEYKSRMSRAIADSNAGQAQKQLTGLAKFEADHTSKAEVAEAALENGLGTQIINKNGSWQIGDGKMTVAQLRTNGGLAIVSRDLVNEIRQEADALSKSLGELEAAYNLKFTATSTKSTGVSNVQESPKQRAGKEVQLAAVETKDAQAAGVARETPAGTADGAARVTRATPINTQIGDANESNENGQKAAKAAALLKETLTETTTVNEEASASSVNTVETKKTETTEGITVNKESNAENSTDKQEIPELSGVLSAFQQTSPEGTPYKKRLNLIADLFKQSPGREGDATLRPLVIVKDFIDALRKDAGLLLTYVNLTELSKEQKDVVSLFSKADKTWSKVFEANKFKRLAETSDFFFRDMFQFLIQTDLDGKETLDSNLKTAMSYAAFSWIAENAGQSAVNSKEDINRLLDRDESHPVSPQEQKALGLVGNRQNTVINQLGQRAVQALGLSVNQLAGSNEMARLESGLGAHIMKMMVDTGLLKRNIISGQEMAALTGNSLTETNAKFNFLSLARDENFKLSKDATEIFEGSRKTQGLLNKLFSVESSLREPSMTPVVSNQKTTKNTKQGLPEALVKAIAHEDSVGNYVNQEMLGLFSGLDEDIQLQIAGAESVDASTAHVSTRLPLQSKNDGLRREISRFMDFVGVMKDGKAPMFFRHVSYKQQRVAIDGNVINPQSSKFHREMLFQKSWETIVNFANSAEMENFNLRVAENLGIKTDKKDNVVNIEIFKKKIADPTIQAAVAILQEHLKNSEEVLSAEEQTVLLAGVKAGGKNTASLAALMALAQMENASQANETNFTVKIMGEVDGVTNGPMLSHLLLGAANTVEGLYALLNRGGFFEIGNKHTNYNQWRGDVGNFDLYETTTQHMNAEIQSLMVSGIVANKYSMTPGQVSVVMQAVYAFTGELVNKETGEVEKAGRDIIKTPLTAMVFGSSVFAAVESMANNFVDSIYAGIEDLATKKNPTKQDRVDLIGNINLLLSQGKAEWIDHNLTVKELMELEFDVDQIKAVKRAFSNTLGFAVKNTMETDFENFIQKRAQFNTAARLAFELYNATYEALRTEYVKELARDGKIAMTEKGAPKAVHDLNPEQEAVLAKRMGAMTPLLHTPMSKPTGQLNAGLRISKSGKKLSTKYTHKSDIKFADGTTMEVNGFETVEENPGVAMLVSSIHSADSAAMMLSLGKRETLNIFDATGVGLAGFTEAAQSLNKSLFNVMLNFSPANEMLAALSRTVMGLAALMDKGEVSPAAITNIAKAINTLAVKEKMDPKTLLADMVKGMKAMAFEADSIKLQVLAIMGAVDQYALQGGEYPVSDDDRAMATKMLGELDNAVNPALLKAVQQITTLLQKELGAETQAEPADIMQDTKPVPVKTKVLTGDTPFGPLGTPQVAPDQDLVDFFEVNKEVNFKRVVQSLLRKYKNEPGLPNAGFNSKLLKALVKFIDPEMMVKYITPDTAATLPIAGVQKNARGWTGFAGGKTEIYVMSPAFQSSGLTPELLVHELLHSAISRLLASKEKALQPYIKELNELLIVARKYADSSNLSDKFATALSNLDELVSWGMTNQEFQQEVLAKAQMQSTTLGKLTDLLQAFIGNMAGLLGFKDTASAKGLGVLIANVSGILSTAAALQEQSSQETGAKNLAMNVSAAQATLNTYSTIDLYEALDTGTISPAFDAQLRGLLGSMVSKLYGPFGSFKESLMKDQALTPMDVWFKALNTGVAPFASSILGSGFKMTEQSAFVIEQVEATVRAALDAKEAHSKVAYKELDALYTEIQKKLKVEDFHTGDWTTATPSEQANAQNLYDFIFKVEQSNGSRSDYLSRFAAMGLAHEGFNQMLKTATETGRQRSSAVSFADRLQIVFENILAFFNGKVTNTYKGQNADAKITALVGQLIDIEAKERHKLNSPVRNKFTDSFEDGVKAASDVARNKVSSWANSSFIRENSNLGVRTAGALVRTVADDNVDFFIDNLRTMRNSAFKGKLGVVASALGELKGSATFLQALLRGTKSLEKMRKTLISDASKGALWAFADNGKRLSTEAKSSVSAVFMRTGAHALLKDFSLPEIEQLLSNRAEMSKSIASFEAKLNSFNNAKFYFIEQANALAIQVATGLVAGEFTMMNSHNIAKLYGTAYQGKLTEARTEEAQKIIEVLTVLYSIEYMGVAQRNEAAKLLATENQRTDGNGVEFVLKLHKHLEEEALARLFKGRPELMMHGYTSEIYDPNVDIKSANEIDGKNLINHGYTKGARVSLDKGDPNRQVKHLYIRKGGGMQSKVSGIVSITGMTNKGSENHNGYLDTNTYIGAQNASANADMMASRTQAIADMFKPGPRRDLSKVKANHMAPVLNEQGNVVKWRYLMSEATKDSVLSRDNRFERVLGMMAGSVFDKETSQEQNKTAMKAIKEQFDLDWVKNPTAYVLVGQESTDKDMKEIWNMLPEKTKKDAEAIFGSKGMVVRNDTLDIMFGYRKASLADMFEKDPKLQRSLEKMFVYGMNTVLRQSGRIRGMSAQEAEDYAKRAASIVNKGEKVWQALVAETKDIIVVKTGIVMLGNIYSNMTLLAMNGVPLRSILYHHLVALRSASAYQRDMDELGQLKLQRNSGYTQGNDKEIASRIARLENSIDRNPIKELVDSGLMPTIVEDVSLEEDLYSYPSQFAQSVSKYTDKLNPKVKSLAKTLYMSKDTKMYQGLSRVTQLSDFVARYTLYQHNTTKRNPMTKEKAIQDASDSFVNYDIPMHKALQYLDDMGILPFTKYFLRIQKVLLTLMREKPGRVLAVLAMEQYIDLGSTVLDGSVWGRLGNNPFGAGAFKYFTVLDDLATVNATMSLIKP